MAPTFHPLPVVGAIKTFAIAVILSPFLMLFSLLFGGIFPLLFLFVWGAATLNIIAILIRSRYRTVVLEDNNVTYITGILSRKRVVLPYQRISEASYDQGFVQRIFGVGTLRIDTAGGTTMAISVPDIIYKDLQEILGVINKKSGGGVVG